MIAETYIFCKEKKRKKKDYSKLYNLCVSMTRLSSMIHKNRQ